jgi:hypothetical protein
VTELRGYGATYTILDACRTAIITELSNRTGADVAHANILTGAIAWDECDGTQCGQLALSAQRHYFSDTIPIEVVQVVMATYGGGAFLTTDCAVQLIRCAPVPQGRAVKPADSALDASAHQVLDDGYSLLCAVTTQLQYMKDTDQIVDYLIRQLAFAGPEGACVGSELTFAVGVNR